MDKEKNRLTTPAHHPDEEILIAHASGQLDRGYRVLIEAHLALCPQCTQDVAALQRPGGQLLRELDDSPPSDALWQAIEQRLDDLPEDPLAATPLPLGARAELALKSPRRVARLPFSTARISSLWADPDRDVQLLMISIAPGHTFPGHQHLGCEQVQVLTGGYEDPYGHFKAGDFAPYPASTAHAPQIDEDEPCWIVTRIEQGVRFSGWRGWMMRFAGR